ncbi:MAG: DNA-binding protein [Candidatus Krumholzibacteria bacterium]|nr:DNA-binding protein [Candidatus Krumholzibacteria bacterium]
MKKSALVFTLLAVVLMIALAGCGEKKETTETAPAATAEATTTQASNPNVWKGEVLETMNSGGYTYVYLDTGSEKIWAAGPETQVSVGQTITMDKGMAMPQFHAKSLDRTFEVIYFVGSIQGSDGVKPAAEAAHGGSDMGMGSGGGHNVVAQTEVKDVTKAAGGYTIEEIYTQSAALSGKPVKVRGQVVKFTANIMGTNWVHIQDGTGSGPTSDLTVTTSAVVASGDMVTVEGSLTVNKDFGAGYKYDAIIEGAKVTKE